MHVPCLSVSLSVTSLFLKKTERKEILQYNGCWTWLSRWYLTLNQQYLGCCQCIHTYMGFLIDLMMKTFLLLVTCSSAAKERSSPFILPFPVGRDLHGQWKFPMLIYQEIYHGVWHLQTLTWILRWMLYM